MGQGVLRANSERSPASQGHLDSNPTGARALENQRRRGHILDGDARAVENDNLIGTPAPVAGASELIALLDPDVSPGLPVSTAGGAR